MGCRKSKAAAAEEDTLAASGVPVNVSGTWKLTDDQGRTVDYVWRQDAGERGFTGELCGHSHCVAGSVQGASVEWTDGEGRNLVTFRGTLLGSKKICDGRFYNADGALLGHFECEMTLESTGDIVAEGNEGQEKAATAIQAVVRGKQARGSVVNIRASKGKADQGTSGDAAAQADNVEVPNVDAAQVEAREPIEVPFFPGPARWANPNESGGCFFCCVPATTRGSPSAP